MTSWTYIIRYLLPLDLLSLPLVPMISILVTPPAHAPLAYGSLRYAGVRWVVSEGRKTERTEHRTTQKRSGWASGEGPKFWGFRLTLGSVPSYLTSVSRHFTSSLRFRSVRRTRWETTEGGPNRVRWDGTGPVASLFVCRRARSLRSSPYSILWAKRPEACGRREWSEEGWRGRWTERDEETGGNRPLQTTHGTVHFGFRPSSAPSAHYVPSGHQGWLKPSWTIPFVR